MPFCKNCGAQVEAAAKFCPSCGAVNDTSNPAVSDAAVPPSSASFGTTSSPGATSASNQVNTPLGNIDFSFNAATVGVADPNDVAANKGMAILSYIIFFIPLIAGTHKTSPFVCFHVNQGTALAIAAIIYNIALTIILNVITFVLPWWLWVQVGSVLSLLHLAPFVLMVFGIVNAVNGTLKQLPLIGGLSIIK